MTTLTQVSESQAQKAVTVNDNFVSVSPAGLFGYKAATSAALTWGYFGGVINVDGTQTTIADGTLALTASTTNYIEATRAGVVSKNVIGFTAGQIPLYTVVTGTATVTSYTDFRQLLTRVTTAAISVAVTSADVTLTAIQARAEIITVTGVKTGARNLIVPAVAAAYQISNTGTGGFALTVKTPSGTGVAMVDGATATVFCDGTNVIGVGGSGSPILGTIFDAKGDLIVGTAADTAARLPVGANGTVPMARSPDAAGLAYVAALTKAIYGFTYANAAVDVTNDIDIAAGGAMDATGAYWITGAASTKQLDAAWAVGSGVGGLDTGSIANSDYYIWAIARSDTGVVDYLFSLSSTAPTMPASYNFKRLIGWFKRVSGAIVAFHTYELEGGGLELLWDSPTLDIDLANTLTTARRTDAVKVPLNFSVEALLNISVYDAGPVTFAYIYCPDLTDIPPGNGVAPLATQAAIATYAPVAPFRVRTSAAGLIAARADVATVDIYKVATLGFKWGRRN